MAKRKLKENQKDTKFYHYINLNPKDKYVGDCVIRALACTFDIPWDEVFLELAKIGFEEKCPLNDCNVVERFLESRGYKRAAVPRKKNRKMYKVRDFIKNPSLLSSREDDSPIYFTIRRHASCLKLFKGVFKVHDIWNCSEGFPMRIYIKSKK